MESGYGRQLEIVRRLLKSKLALGLVLEQDEVLEG